MERYDSVVIGAGMAGLTFACLAAHANKRVLVVDQHYLPGGSFTAFKNGPYVFNVALEWTNECAPGQRLDTLMGRLGLREAYPFARVDVFKSVMSSELSAPVAIPTGTDRLRQALVDAFPHQAAEIDRFLADCVAVVKNSSAASAILTRFGIKPVEKMLADYFSAPLAAHALFSLIAYPGARGVLLMYMVGAICLDHVWRPVHRDHRRLPSLLHRRIASLGGKVVLRKKVSRILVENDAAYGIELEGGEQIMSTNVVANTDPYQLYTQLLEPKPEMPALAHSMLTREPSLSCFCVFLGLDQSVQALTQHQSSYSLLADASVWNTLPLDLAGIPLRVEMQTAHYPQLAPPGHATICVWAAQPISAFDFWGQQADREIWNVGAYEAAKAKATEIVLTRLERAMPGLRASIVLVDAATPFTFKYYTCAHSGAVSGYTLASMSYLKTLPSKTHIAGLYHIGQWTTQSGVNMAMYSGSDLFDNLFGAVHS